MRYATGSYGWKMLKKWFVVGNLKSNPNESIPRIVTVQSEKWNLIKARITTQMNQKWRITKTYQTFRLASPTQRNALVESLAVDR